MLSTLARVSYCPDLVLAVWIVTARCPDCRGHADELVVRGGKS